MSQDDFRVGVINEGPFEPTWFWDGKPYRYTVTTPDMLKIKRPTVRWIPLQIAYEHWGVQLSADGKLERAYDVKPQDDESQMAHRMGGLIDKVFYPLKDSEGNVIRNPQGQTLGNYEDNRIVKDWFLHKVHFRLRKIAEYEEELVNS